MGSDPQFFLSLFIPDMRSMAKKNDRSDRLFASPPPKSTIFGPLGIYAYLVIIGRLLMIIRNCRKEGGRKEGRKEGRKKKKKKQKRDIYRTARRAG